MANVVSLYFWANIIESCSFVEERKKKGHEGVTRVSYCIAFHDAPRDELMGGEKKLVPLRRIVVGGSRNDNNVLYDSPRGSFFFFLSFACSAILAKNYNDDRMRIKKNIKK